MANTKEARIVWQQDMVFKGDDGDGHTIILDAEPQHGGTIGGFSPMELLLMGLGGCTIMDVMSIMRKKKQDLTGLEIHVTGYRAGEHPKVYERIELEFVARGRNISEKALARSIELSETKYCSASAMLGKTAEIVTTYRIIEEE